MIPIPWNEQISAFESVPPGRLLVRWGRVMVDGKAVGCFIVEGDGLGGGGGGGGGVESVNAAPGEDLVGVGGTPTARTVNSTQKLKNAVAKAEVSASEAFVGGEVTKLENAIGQVTGAMEQELAGKFNKSGGVINGNTETTGNAQVDGNLAVGGNATAGGKRLATEELVDEHIADAKLSIQKWLPAVLTKADLPPTIPNISFSWLCRVLNDGQNNGVWQAIPNGVDDEAVWTWFGDNADFVNEGDVIALIGENKAADSAKFDGKSSNEFMPSAPRAIAENSDLNNYLTNGLYGTGNVAIAQTILNVPDDLPEGQNFTLFVEGNAFATGWAKQTLTSMSSAGPRMWMRTCNNTPTWSAWVRVADRNWAMPSAPVALTTGQDLNTLLNTGFYQGTSAVVATLVNAPTNTLNCTLLVERSTSDNNIKQTYTSMSNSAASSRTWIRTSTNAGWSAWREIAYQDWVDNRLSNYMSTLTRAFPTGTTSILSITFLGNGTYSNPGFPASQFTDLPPGFATGANNFTVQVVGNNAYLYDTNKMVGTRYANDIWFRQVRQGEWAGDWTLVSNLPTSPHLWPTSGVEINFGDGTFGRRYTGYIIQTAGQGLNRVLTSNASATGIISCGGWFQLGATDPSKNAIGAAYVSPGTNALTASSNLYINSANGFTFNSLSQNHRTDTTNNAYDIWVRYTK